MAGKITKNSETLCMEKIVKDITRRIRVLFLSLRFDSPSLDCVLCDNRDRGASDGNEDKILWGG